MKNIIIVFLILVIIILAYLAFSRQDTVSQDSAVGARVSWATSPIFDLQYQKQSIDPIECYEDGTGKGEIEGSCVSSNNSNFKYTPSPNDVPIFRGGIISTGVGSEIMWGNYLNQTCAGVEQSFSYGVSTEACVKGRRTVLVNPDPNYEFTKEELDLFSDFIIRNK